MILLQFLEHQRKRDPLHIALWYTKNGEVPREF